MADFTTRITELATSLGTKLKAINLKLSGVSDGSLSGLTTAAKTNLVAAINEVKAQADAIAASAGAQINDASSSSATQVWSINRVKLEVQNAKDSILGGAGAAYDTLSELQALLEGDAAELADIMTALAKRIRFDAAQTLTTQEKLQARQNMDAQSASEIGFADNDFVAVLNAAMV